MFQNNRDCSRLFRAIPKRYRMFWNDKKCSGTPDLFYFVYIFSILVGAALLYPVFTCAINALLRLYTILGI